MGISDKIHAKRMKYLKKKKAKAYERAKQRHQVQREKKAIASAESIARPSRKPGGGKSFGSVLKSISSEAAKWAPPEKKGKKKKVRSYEPPPVRLGGFGRV